MQQKNIIEPSNFSSIFDMGSKDYFHIKDEIKDEIFKDVGGAVKKNEADAIFGVRYVGAERSADKTMNSIQNIILQEMENLEGILIATTNLTENLDKAFERRFLYKVCFTAPDSSTKTKILKSMLPELSQEQAQTLAESFNLSGGQIENVARRITIASLLSGQEVAFEQIKEFCKEESIGGKSDGGSRKIGY